VKVRDESGREYVLMDDALVDVVFYFSIVLAAVLTVLALLAARLP
jgi:hypothetical protein